MQYANVTHFELEQGIKQNSSSSKWRTFLYYLVNIMVADVLATQGTRASAAMILT